MRFIFSNCGSIESSLIQWFEGSRWSHCGAIMPDSTVIEALWSGGVQRNKLIDFLEDSDDWAIFDIALPNEVAAEQFLIEQIGKPYDKTAIIGIVFERDWDSSDSWYCSELSTKAIEMGGFSLADGDSYSRVGVRLALEFMNGLKLSQAIKPEVD